jgi:5'-nucleotidase / UDP-sugar diphosphatase
MNMKRHLTFILSLLFISASLWGAEKRKGEIDFRLTILHSDDSESQLIDAGPGLEDFGGVARFATLADRLKVDARQGSGSKQVILFVSCGDNIFPGAQLNASLVNGIPFYETIAMESIGYDVSALGNHDFDFGPDVLADFISGFHSLPFVAANLDFQNEPALQALVSTGQLARSTLLHLQGEKIGVIGAIAPTLSITASPRNVIIETDLVAAVQAQVEILQEHGAKVIVLLTHLGNLGEDEVLLSQLHGIDILVGAGSENTNELQANPGNLLIPGDVPFAPYPILANDADGKEVPIVSTTGNYRYIGRLTVSFDEQGNLIEIDQAKSQPYRVAGANQPDGVQPDTKLQKKVVEPVRAAVEALSSNVIATSEVDLDGLETNVRTIETNEANLIADSHLSEATRLAPDFGAPLPDIAIVNGGAIRNNSILPAGAISELDTFNMVPFPNLLAIVPNIPPSQLKEILENAVSKVQELDGRFAQVSGIRFTWDPTGTAQILDSAGNVVTAGTRIREASLNDGTVIVSSGAVVINAPTVTIATTTFLANSGDQYPFRGKQFTNLGISMQQAVFNFILNTLGGVISASDYPESGEGRIQQ